MKRVLAMRYKKFFKFIFSVSLLFQNVFTALGDVTQQPNVIQTTATLSQARNAFAATSLGALVFFGGGQNATGPSDQVDICNVTSRNWTTTTLSVPRWDLAAASSESLVFFAGGYDGSNYHVRVDIYNMSSGNWSTATLSQARCCLAATSVEAVVLFAGGYNGSVSNVVDIYNVSNNTWTVATLSVAREGLTATSVSSRYALFAGGNTGSINLNAVDIFDLISETWSTAALSQARQWLAAVSLGNLALFGGGMTSGNLPSNLVDIFNATTQTWSTATLSQSRYCLAAASISEIAAFGGGTPDNFTSSSVVDMYNGTSNSWFTMLLSQPRFLLAATSSTNQIFFGGGYDGISGNYFPVVDIFEFPSPPPSPPTLPPQRIQTLPTPMMTTLNNVPMRPPVTQESNTSTGTAQSTNSIDATLLGVTIVLMIGMIAVIAGLVVVIIVVLRLKQQMKKDKNEQVHPLVDTKTQSVVLEDKSHNVSDNAAVTITEAVSTYQPVTETLKGLSPGQIPLNELEIGREIGQGTYGRVCVGKWKKYRVALKFCQNRGKMDEFMREANLMISLPPHPNVVRMYGVSIDGTQPIIVMEYCAGGSLDKILFDEKVPISNEQKIEWVHEIAEGMCHLHKFNIIHRDLAARNILLTQPNQSGQLKVSDFGMSRVLQRDIEGQTLNATGPIRWMAPESIEKQVYSKKSDMWMFGVLVYEIVAQSEPHVNVDPKQVGVLICRKGLTPTIPRNCPPLLRELMESCWQKDPTQRPTFEEICARLRQ
jgi:hypothetical protein